MSPRRRPNRARRAFTAVEMVIALALAGIVVGNLLLVLSDTRERFASQSLSKDVDAAARRALDRIALQIQGAVRSQLYSPVGAPLSSDSINYTSVVGTQNGEPIVSPPQRIALSQDPKSSVTWYQNPGQSSEMRVVWARDLRDFCAGEVLNGVDDNGNGLVDEKGLAFEVEGAMVRITLTLERIGPDGQVVTKTLETRVTCRN